MGRAHAVPQPDRAAPKLYAQLFLPAQYEAPALRAVQAVLARVDAAGIVGGVSYGTPVGNDAQFYKDIPVCPMTYGQAMAILMLAEALYHIGEDA